MTTPIAVHESAKRPAIGDEQTKGHHGDALAPTPVGAELVKPVSATPSGDSDEFRKWLLQKGRRGWFIAGVAFTGLLWSANLFEKVPISQTLQKIAAWPHMPEACLFAQAMICAIMAAFIPDITVFPRPPGDPPNAASTEIERFRLFRGQEPDLWRLHVASGAARQLGRDMMWTFVAWAVLYAALGTLDLVEHSIGRTGSTLGFSRHIAFAVLNTATTWRLLECYFTMSSVTVPIRQADDAHIAQLRKKNRISIVLLFGAASAFLAIRFTRFLKEMTGASVATDAGWSESFLGASLNLAAGCTIALLAGRLDSKLIQLDAIAIGSIYLYALIQPLADRLHEGGLAKLVLTSLALAAKMLLFAVWTWMAKTHRAVAYMYAARALSDSGDELREFVAKRLESKKPN